MNNIDQQKWYVFYDGECGFCNHWVQWILENDSKDQFMFASLQSNFGQAFLKDRGLPIDDFTTMYLWKPNQFYLAKSEAVLQIAKVLDKWYSNLVPIASLLPTWLSDAIYMQISNNRTKLSSAKCLLPTPEQRKKFIE